jgi:hypothetical protein
MCEDVLKIDIKKTDFADFRFNTGSFAFAAFDVKVIF